MDGCRRTGGLDQGERARQVPRSPTAGRAEEEPISLRLSALEEVKPGPDSLVPCLANEQCVSPGLIGKHSRMIREKGRGNSEEEYMLCPDVSRREGIP